MGHYHQQQLCPVPRWHPGLPRDAATGSNVWGKAGACTAPARSDAAHARTGIVGVQLQWVLERLNLELRQRGRSEEGGQSLVKTAGGGGGRRRRRRSMAPGGAVRPSRGADRVSVSSSIEPCGVQAGRRAGGVELAWRGAATARQRPGRPLTGAHLLDLRHPAPRKRGRPSGAPQGSVFLAGLLLRAPVLLPRLSTSTGSRCSTPERAREAHSQPRGSCSRGLSLGREWDGMRGAGRGKRGLNVPGTAWRAQRGPARRERSARAARMAQVAPNPSRTLGLHPPSCHAPPDLTDHGAG